MEQSMILTPEQFGTQLTRTVSQHSEHTLTRIVQLLTGRKHRSKEFGAGYEKALYDVLTKHESLQEEWERT